ncbi:MAG: ATP-binding protein [Lachnospiraceae bacterium]|nr:ATP-binding protein [Lachnospiraceae bacterium]
MGKILNSAGQLVQFQKLYNDKYFVDKSSILTKLNESINTGNNYICITRPRRFGKTVMTNLISSYYAKGLDSAEIFDKLKIADKEDYKQHLNQHNVISLYMSDMPEDCSGYGDYICFHRNEIKQELMTHFPDCHLAKEQSLSQMFEHIFYETGERFIFIVDEWDSFFHSDFYTEEGAKSYLTFLRNLLKDKPYVELAYMTGVLPIKKYSSGSELNMFDEFYFPTDTIYDTFFGFSEEEVKELCERNKQNGGSIKYEQLAQWYNGYYTSLGSRLYNPRSINKALNQNTVKDYWTETGPGTEILELIKNNVGAVKEDILKMVSGEKIYFPFRYFKTEFANLRTRQDILSIMIIYGFLSYYKDYVNIPNKELMTKFETVLEDSSMGYIAELAKNSNVMLEATLAGDTKKMEEILEFVHNTEVPILQYNDENSLSCIVNLIYLNARDKYRIEREEKTGKGFADFIFYPLNTSDTAIILELKKDDTPENAIAQIMERKYYTKLLQCKDGNPVCEQDILVVGMTYDTKNKSHQCVVQKLGELK